LRYLLRNKGYTAINILGLAVGITCCVLIMLFVRSEWSYDAFHKNSGRIYRTWQHEKVDGQDFINTVTPLSMGPVLRATFPEVENECRIYPFAPLVRLDKNTFSEDTRMVDSTFFEMFDFPLLEGNRSNPFPNSNSVILTKETALKYFGRDEPMGKNLEIQLGEEKILFTVTGIIKKAPENSSIKYNLLIPFSNAKLLFRPGAFTSWTTVFAETYVLLRKGVSGATLESKFTPMIKQVLGENFKEGAFLVHLQPMKKIHLDKSLPAGNEPISNPKYSFILATIGLLVLLIACVNFITLSVGRSTTRALEVGVRKTMGAERSQLVRQFWGEAFLLTLVSVMIGIGLAALLVHPFNQLISRELSLHFDTGFLLFCVLLIALIALISGIYPALILSRFNPVEVLKGKLKMKGNTGWLRQGLVVGQFVASIGMIICTLTISKQMNFLKNKDLGYNKEQVVIVSTNKSRKEGFPLGDLYRTELLKHPEVTNATVSVYSFAENSWLQTGFLDEKNVYRNMEYNAVDPYFIKTMNIGMASGRAFDPENTADISSSAIVNEAFVKEFGLTDPVGKKLPGPFDQQIIGVVKDFNVHSLHTQVDPLLLTIMADSVLRRVNDISYQFVPKPRISVQLKAGNLAHNIDILREAWKTIAPNQEFEYKFLDESVAAQYKADQRTGSIVRIASILSIFIACMGLFGLATLAVTRRTREIGIRKVMGANPGNIIGLLSKDFLRLVIIAAIIAVPVSWWFMKDWLKDFAYRVNISWIVFIMAALAALVVALFTVSLQAYRAAMANPVKSLRTE
ncbi:MAG TPA: ABC transporter permease, partial [Chitinophagaceae bacterium]|nr:ABC transporter permease [Chitinophagaceae bacterium]